MKWLIVTYISDNRMFAKQAEQCRMIQTVCKEKKGTAEYWIYTDEKLDAEKIPQYFTGQVYYEADSYLSPNRIAQKICDLNSEKNYEGIIFTDGGFAVETVGIIAEKLDCACITGGSRLEWEEEALAFYKPVYNCNMEAKFCLPSSFVISLVQLKVQEQETETAAAVVMSEIQPEQQSNYLKEKTLVKPRKVQGESEILLAVGKGISSKDEVNKLRIYAKEKGYLFGVSRPVAMNGWGAIDEIIGVSGHIYAPEICIAVGVSGSAAFYAGIQNSKWIAAINIDKKAPIIKMSDISIIDDYANVWDHLSELL